MSRMIVALRALLGRLPFLILGIGFGVVVYLAVESPSIDELHECEQLAAEAVVPFVDLRDMVKRAATRDARDHVAMFREAYARCH